MGGKNYRSISSLNRCISSPVHITLSEHTLRSFTCRMYASREFVKKHITLWATTIFICELGKRAPVIDVGCGQSGTIDNSLDVWQGILYVQ